MNNIYFFIYLFNISNFIIYTGFPKSGSLLLIFIRKKLYLIKTPANSENSITAKRIDV